MIHGGWRISGFWATGSWELGAGSWEGQESVECIRIRYDFLLSAQRVRVRLVRTKPRGQLLHLIYDISAKNTKKKEIQPQHHQPPTPTCSVSFNNLQTTSTVSARCCSYRQAANEGDLLCAHAVCLDPGTRRNVPGLDPGSSENPRQRPHLQLEEPRARTWGSSLHTSTPSHPPSTHSQTTTHTTTTPTQHHAAAPWLHHPTRSI
jgi:hypothetical protein